MFNSHRPSSRLSGLAACALLASALLGGAGAAHAGRYAMTSLADSSGSLGTIGMGPPALNDARQVAFGGRLDDFTAGLFAVAPGVALITRATAATSGPYTVFGDPDIAANGTISTGAGLRDGTRGGVFTGAFDSGALTRVTDGLSAGYTVLGANVAINNSGVVTYYASNGSLGGVYAGTAAPVALVASSAGPMASFRATTHINDAGTVVFAGTTDAGARGVFTASQAGGALVTVADSSGPLNVFNDAPTINAAGVVLFTASFDAGGQGIFKRDLNGNGALETVVTTAGPLATGLFDVAINDAGQLAFTADFDAGGTGLFAGADLETDLVIRTGDALFGSTVTGLLFAKNGLNNHGDIAFNYTLANGLRGIAIATLAPVPEPASVTLMLGGVGLLWMCRRRRAL